MSKTPRRGPARFDDRFDDRDGRGAVEGQQPLEGVTETVGIGGATEYRGNGVEGRRLDRREHLEALEWVAETAQRIEPAEGADELGLVGPVTEAALGRVAGYPRRFLPSEAGLGLGRGGVGL